MFISVNGFANSCNEQSFATAEALFDQVQERFDTGLASKVDLVEAKAFYWQQKICLNKVSKKAFCEVGMEFQKESLASIQSAYEVGTANFKRCSSTHTKCCLLGELLSVKI